MALFSDAAVPVRPFPKYRVIETEHIKIIYQERDEQLAREIESFAEPLFREVSSYLSFTPPGKVPVLIDSKTDTPNGAFAPAPDRVIILPSPLSPFRLKTLFIHELVHYINLTSPSGMFGFLGRIFGDGVRGVNSALIPGWMAEGITVYLETLLTEAGRGRDEEFKAILKGFLYDNAPWEHWKSVYAVESYPRNRIYLAGYFLVRYLSEEYGAKSFMQLFRRWTGWAFFSQNLALKHVTGKTLKEFYQEMIDSWEERWAGDFTIGEGERITLSFAGPGRHSGNERIEGEYYPVSANREELIFYYSGGKEAPGLYSLDLHSIHESNDSTDSDDSEGSGGQGSGGGSSGGQRAALIQRIVLTREEAVDTDLEHRFILFAARSFRERAAGSSIFGPPSLSNLYLLDRQSGSIRQVTEEGSYLDPAISEDGSLIIAVRVQNKRCELVQLSVGGDHGGDQPLQAQPEVLAHFPAEASLRHPRISPDMRWILFTAAPREGEVELYLLQREDGSLYRIPLPGSREARPEWRDDRSFLFSSDRTGSLAIHLLSFEGSGEKGLTDSKITASIQKLVSDPVGADRAIAAWEGDRYIYRSYRSGGKLLFSTKVVSPETGALSRGGGEEERNLVLQPLQEATLSSASSPSGASNLPVEPSPVKSSPVEPAGAEPAPSRGYIPLPLPHTLIPFLTLDLYSGELIPVLGATILAGEASETAELSLSASILPKQEQLEGRFRLSHRFFSGSLNLLGERSYVAASAADAYDAYSRSDLSISLNHPIYSSLGPFRIERLSASLSGMVTSLRSGNRNFTFQEEPKQELRRWVSTSLGISSFTRSYPHSSRAFYGGNDLEMGVSGTWAPALLEREKGELIGLAKSTGGFLPLKGSNVRITLGGRLLYTTGVGTKGYIAYQNSPDWNVSSAAERQGRAFLSLALQIPAPLFETRILWIPVTRFGISFFAETGFTFQNLELFEPDRLMVAGLELDSRIMISRIPMLFTLVGAFRFDYHQSFDLQKDFTLSIRIGPG